MAKEPELAKIIKWFAERNIKEEVARKWFAHYAKIGWENLGDPYRALQSWVDYARPSDLIVRPKDLTPTEPLARGQPTFAMNRVEPPRELTEDELAERAAMIVELKTEPLAPLLVSLRQKAILWQKTPTLVPGMTQELFDRVMRYDEAIRRLRISKEEYL